MSVSLAGLTLRVVDVDIASGSDFWFARNMSTVREESRET
jgi:hypothetical protein